MVNQKKQVLLRRPEVEVVTGLSRSAVYDRLNPRSRYFDSTFPQPIRVGSAAVRWYAMEVDAWVASRPRTRQIAANEDINPLGALDSNVLELSSVKAEANRKVKRKSADSADGNGGQGE